MCTYHFSEWSNFRFLHNSKWSVFFTQSRLLLYFFLYQFAAFDHYVIKSFISIITKLTFDILLSIFSFYFNVISHNDIILCCYEQKFSFSFYVSPSCWNHLICNFLSLSLKVSILLSFFAFSFFSCFLSLFYSLCSSCFCCYYCYRLFWLTPLFIYSYRASD